MDAHKPDTAAATLHDRALAIDDLRSSPPPAMAAATPTEASAENGTPAVAHGKAGAARPPPAIPKLHFGPPTPLVEDTPTVPAHAAAVPEAHADEGHVPLEELLETERDACASAACRVKQACARVCAHTRLVKGPLLTAGSSWLAMRGRRSGARRLRWATDGL